MSKLSRGTANDLAATVILAADKARFSYACNECKDVDTPSDPKNFNLLFSFGYKFIGPTDGEMACGEYGKGKMSSPRQIISYLEKIFLRKKIILKKKNIKAIVTTGPTKEYIDPVGFISNESSGKQGHEIALELERLELKQLLISGPTNINYSKDIKVKRVTSGKQMFDIVKRTLPADIAVSVLAAVSDLNR